MGILIIAGLVVLVVALGLSARRAVTKMEAEWESDRQERDG